MWSIIFSVPCWIIVLITDDPQALVTYTGGICGTFILFLFPLMLINDARKKIQTRGAYGENPNKSPFQSVVWWWIILVFAIITLFFVILGIINGTAGE